MGKLYLAHDPKLDRDVAIKTLLEGLDDDEIRGRFEREARAVARLAHRNIVVVHDFGDHKGHPFIAMEYIRGETLYEKIRRRAPIALKIKLRYMSELCSGLASAHTARVIHRDIKPANLMITLEGVLKILDFGIARQGESRHTRTGVLMGTLNYMSPEQMGGKTVDHRSDMFAVGAVCYELLAYTKAFPGTFQDGLFGRILAAAPESLAIKCPDLDPDIIRIVERAIKREPDQRYADLGEMAADLDAVLAGSTTRAHVRAPGGGGTGTHPITPPSGQVSSIRKKLAKRRTSELKKRVVSAEQALGRGELDTAEEECEQALLMDAMSTDAFALLERVHAQQLELLISEVHRNIGEGALTAADAVIDRARALAPKAPKVDDFSREVARVRAKLEQEHERAVAIERAIGQARDALAQGALEVAIRASQDVLRLDERHDEALRITREATEKQRQREALEQRAHTAVEQAQARFADHDHLAAIAILESFDPPHDHVKQALHRLRLEAAELERRQRLEADQREQALKQGAAKATSGKPKAKRKRRKLSPAPAAGEATVQLDQDQAEALQVEEAQAAMAALREARAAIERLLSAGALDRVEQPLAEAEARFGAAELQPLRDRFALARAAGEATVQLDQDQAEALQVEEAQAAMAALREARAAIERLLSAGALDRVEQPLAEAEARFGAAELQPLRDRFALARAAAEAEAAVTIGSGATIPTPSAPPLPDSGVWAPAVDAVTTWLRTLPRGVQAAAAVLVVVTTAWWFWPVSVPMVTVDAMPWATVRIMPVGAEQGVDAIERITPFAVPLADGDYLFTFGPDGDPTAYEETRHVAEGSRTIRLEIPGTDAKTLVDRLLSETR